MKRIDRLMSGWFRKTLFDPFLWITLIVSVLISSLGDEQALRSASHAIGTAQVQTGSVFLGLVIAGLAILVVFLDKDYISLLEKAPPGVDADIWPFKYTAFVAVVCSLLGMVLIIVGYPDVIIFRVLLCFSLWSFTYLLWTMFELVKYVAGHAKTRALQIKLQKKENQPPQQPKNPH